MCALAESTSTDPQSREQLSALLDRMVQERQLCPEDAAAYRQIAAETIDDAPASEADVLCWLAEQYELSFTDLSEVMPDRQLLSIFPTRVLLREAILPIARDGDYIEVAIARLFATESLDMLRSLTGLRLRPVLAPAAAIAREMKKHLGVGADTLDTLNEQSAIQVIDDADEGDVDLDAAAQDASIIRFVNQVLSDAIALRATDIHIEPFEDELRIRYRIDGMLQEVPVPASIKRFQPAIVSRVKILSHLDIAEKRLPQDGRIRVRLEKHEVDVRVSLIPMLHGEAVVMRLLMKDMGLRGLDQLGMDDREDRAFRQLLTVPHGIMLVTGPTGSGKSTTLYAALNEINDAERKIITIEDPVEYHIRGINQIQVSEKTGLTFARGLRSVLRHDPDVILIGEIRDTETARIAIQASLTGHLVFSTLHTNDAPGAPTRLIDMGMESYLVAASLEAVMAQRLVRVLCPHCRRENHNPAIQLHKTRIGIPPGHPVYEPVGCEHCRRTGLYGRRAIFELMVMNETLRELILSSRSILQLRTAARQAGMRSLAEDGWRLVREGATSIEEVLRVTRDETQNGMGDETGS